MTVLLAHSRILGKNEYSIFRLNNIYAPSRVLVENCYGAPVTFLISGGPDADHCISDPNPVAQPGTATFTQGSSAVTGVGTTFTALQPGDTVTLQDGQVQGVVLSVTDNTHLTLTQPWAGITTSATLYLSTPTFKTIGPAGVVAFNLPIGGAPNNLFTRVWAVSGPVQFFVEAPYAQLTPDVQDNKRDTFL